MGKNKHKKSNLSIQKLPDNQGISRRNLLFWLAGGAAVILGGGIPMANYLSKAETTSLSSQETNQLETILNSDYLDETLVQDKFEPLTPADQIVINCLVGHHDQYYQEIDKLVSQRGKVSHLDQDVFLLFRNLVLTPVFNQVQRNPDLLAVVSQTFPDLGNLEVVSFIQALDQYFVKKGYHFAYNTHPDAHGSVHACKVTQIKKITQLNGKIWGNPISQNTIYYLDKILVPLYSSRYDLTTRRSGECEENGVITVHPDVNQELFDFFKKSFAGKPYTEIKDESDLFQALICKGLEEYPHNPMGATEFAAQRVKQSQFHEMAHKVYQKLYPVGSDFDSINKTELAAYLTELKNSNNNLAYFSLGVLWNLAGNSNLSYNQARKRLFKFFVSEMYTHQQDFSNINFQGYDEKQHNDEVILKQLPQLSVQQIRQLATKCFMENFPELNKL